MKTPVELSPGRRQIAVRRVILGASTAVTSAIASYGAWRLLALNGFHPIEWAILPLFVILVIPISLSFWTVVFGFIVQLRGGDALSLKLDRVGPGELASVRTAIVIPAYNEEPVRLYAGLKATYESVERSGHLSQFDFFLLSDTSDPDCWIREEMAYDDLRKEVSDPARLIYRNRHDNVERKAGNIADFCATWGDSYRYMVVFDADSLMTGDSLAALVQLMERQPSIGILQTPPVAVERQSLFGRVLQFATRVYGPMFITGLNFWQAGEANYWGHNAIIRIQPFVEHCRLPILPGKAPLGGSILSHDFVEAALMRRAGWKVYVASDLGGSYEEIPANLIGQAARDRRWCQGNLQHARLLTMPGLNWINRVHLAMGVMSYAASPLWMLMTLLTTIEGLRLAFSPHIYFEPGRSPFPVWHVSMASQAILLFASVLTMLLIPKLLSLVIWVSKKRMITRGFGGPWRLTASILAETMFSVLAAPILAMLHSRFVIVTLLGRKVEWAPQDRGDVETPWRDAVRWHMSIMLMGIVWSVLLWWKDRALFWWLSPVLAGWLLCIPFSVWTSKIRLGQWSRMRGLFLTPEEVWPPEILVRFREFVQAAAARSWATDRDGLSWVLSAPDVRSVHLGLLPGEQSPEDPLRENRLQGLRLKWSASGESALLPQEKRELLWDAKSIHALSQVLVVEAQKT